MQQAVADYQQRQQQQAQQQGAPASNLSQGPSPKPSPVSSQVLSSESQLCDWLVAVTICLVCRVAGMAASGRAAKPHCRSSWTTLSCFWEVFLAAQAQCDPSFLLLLQQARRKSIHTQRMSFVRDRYFPRDSIEYVQQEQKLFQGASCLLSCLTECAACPCLCLEWICRHHFARLQTMCAL